MHRRTIILLTSLMAITISTAAQTPEPPRARRIPHTSNIHGDVLSDDYFWLREKSNPEVIAHLERENAYTEAMTKGQGTLRDTLYQEIMRRTKQTDLSVPYRKGAHWYYSRTVEGQQYPLFCRKAGSLDAPEQILLDLNVLAQGHAFLGLGASEVSDDGNLLLYSLDTTGFRVYDGHIRDLRTGKDLPDQVGPINTAVWGSDNRTYYVTTEDAAKRPYRLLRRSLGSDRADLLFEEKDELYRIWISRSLDNRYLFMTSASSTTTEVGFLESASTGSLRVIHPREEGHEYYVDHREGLFYIRTNKDAKNYRLVTAPVADPAFASWKELLPHRPAVKLEDITLFHQHAVFVERSNALLHLRIRDFATGTDRSIAFPEPVYFASPGTNVEYATTVFRYNYQSFITPSSVFDFDMVTGKQTLLKQTEVLGGYDPSRYVSERIWARAADGTSVPISLVYKKGIRRDGSQPLLLYGYGSYGASMPVSFSIPRLSLLDRGVVYALAHIRGGGDLGEEWYDQGKLKKKMNTFTDFIACAEHLIQEGYSAKDRIAMQGGSAGGLLIGAVLNLRPDLFRVAHLAVPFVDVINTMMDASLPLTVGEYLEWGNPNKKDEYEYLKTYCPYSNIRATAYPDMLITTSLNDSQVMYWEPAKYVAKMRATRTDRNPLVFKINMGAGHGGASGRYDAYREQAFINAFLLSRLGMDR